MKMNLSNKEWKYFCQNQSKEVSGIKKTFFKVGHKAFDAIVHF
jgi:hypothetical protein